MIFLIPVCLGVSFLFCPDALDGWELRTTPLPKATTLQTLLGNVAEVADLTIKFFELLAEAVEGRP